MIKAAFRGPAGTVTAQELLVTAQELLVTAQGLLVTAHHLSEGLKRIMMEGTAIAIYRE